jgi:hypothetical protein
MIKSISQTQHFGENKKQKRILRGFCVENRFSVLSFSVANRFFSFEFWQN